MKRLGMLLTAAALFLGLACNANAATTVRVKAQDSNVTVQDHKANLYTVDIDIDGNKPYSSGHIDFSYIYSPDIYMTNSVIAELARLLKSPFKELVSSAVESEMSAALFNYTASGKIDGVGVKKNLTVNSAPDWSKVSDVIRNKDICPGRTASINVKENEEPLEEIPDEVSGDHELNYHQILAKAVVGPEVFKVVDGELVRTSSSSLVMENVLLKSVSARKLVSPLVLDMTGAGSLEASNGQYLPHTSFDMATAKHVDFYGDGFEVAMEWVGANDGLLVAPKADGTVDMSCLFGTAGGYDSGYEKLSLYADKNGIVKGSALNALAVWQDANRNAIADKGEVRSCSELGITSINTNDVQFVSSFEMNGKKHKMWDWWPNAVELRTIATK